MADDASHRVQRTAWSELALHAARAGYDVTVLDPDWPEVERYQEYECDGVITVVPHTALSWSMIVSGVESEAGDEEGA